jgi:hypothetical protein
VPILGPYIYRTYALQVLALDKRFLDPRRSVNPTQQEKEEGIIPLTDSLPIIPQVFLLSDDQKFCIHIYYPCNRYYNTIKNTCRCLVSSDDKVAVWYCPLKILGFSLVWLHCAPVTEAAIKQYLFVC